jgi:hypothetical protein
MFSILRLRELKRPPDAATRLIVDHAIAGK